MKRMICYSVVFTLVMMLAGCASDKDNKESKTDNDINPVAAVSAKNNNFYDDAETYELEMVPLVIEGEVENPGPVDFSSMPLHTVIVKETLLSNDSNKFKGAYRYDGYSLFDLLNDRYLDKANADEFGPPIDLFLEIYNEEGEKVVISWGEIFYPVHLHEIIIASRVMRIVPAKTNDLWPLPGDSKLIVGTDLVTGRNISRPSRIVVRSYPRSFKVDREMYPMFSPVVDVFDRDSLVTSLKGIPGQLQELTYHTIFYGRGRGIHSTQPFSGVPLKEMLGIYFPLSEKNIREGQFAVVALDGYRGIYTYSELMNRNDQSEILLMYRPGEKDGGAFRTFPPGDFFSDRAIKAVSAIYFSTLEE